MKFDLTKQLIGMNGQPALENVPTGIDSNGKYYGFTQEPLTVAVLLKQALNHTDKDTKPDMAKLVERGKFILQINKGISPDFKVDQLTEIKQLLAASGCNAVFFAQIDEIIENKGK